MPSISMLLTMKGRSLHMNTHEGSRSGLFPGLRRHLGLPTRARAGMAGAMLGVALAMSAAPAMAGTNRWTPGGPAGGGGGRSVRVRCGGIGEQQGWGEALASGRRRAGRVGGRAFGADGRSVAFERAVCVGGVHCAPQLRRRGG